MADSNITKQALASSLRELMLEQPFEKINVAQICERCHMNRKSFYYHFRDKYDLVNWIFDTEFIALTKDADLEAPYSERWALIETACEYFYAHHRFYRKALQIKGQNSFTDHFREYIRPLLRSRLVCIFEPEPVDEFEVAFFTDAMICAMERWLLEKDCMEPRKFVDKLKRLREKLTRTLYDEITKDASVCAPPDGRA